LESIIMPPSDPRAAFRVGGWLIVVTGASETLLVVDATLRYVQGVQ
jgi:hypothetical protein